MSIRWPLRHRLLVVACASALAAPAGAQMEPAERDDWALCRPHALLDFFVPGLAPASERATATTDIDAATVTVTEKTNYLLEGDVVVTRADQRIAGDTIRYDSVAGTVDAQGDVRYQDETLLFSADRAQGQMNEDRATLDDVRYQLLSARGNGVAAQARKLGPDKTELDEVTFSSCDPDQRDWEIAAREMELNHDTGVGRARGMRLRFKDVTLLKLPYATFPIDDRRRSGFLYPSVGLTNTGGLDLIVPYYLNLAPNYDATLSPRILTDRGLMLGGEFRYLLGDHSGSFSGTYLPSDEEADRDRHSYEFRHWGALSRHFFVSADIRRVSDDRYFEDFGDSLTRAATSLLPSSAYLHGRGEWWNLSFGGDDYEVTDPLLPQAAEPYQRLPRFTLDAERRFDIPVAVGVRTELVRFGKDDALEGDRYDVHPYVAFPLERAAWYLRPELGVRATSYNLDRDDNDSPSRTTPILSLDTGLFFDRETTWFRRAFRQTLEPRLYYLRVPYENQDDLPVFDTQELTFSFAQLFRPNRFTGADRQADANNVTLAVTTRWLEDETGEERLRLSLGQIRYLDEQRVQLPGVPDTDFNGSAYAAEADFRIDDRWRVALSQLYDPNDDETDLSAIRVQRRFGERGLANLSYRFRRDLLEQVDASTAFPLNDAWRLFGRVNYSLRDDRTLEALAGVEYDACCYALRILGRHYVRNVEGESANALYIELELKGLGSIGQHTEDFLRRAILGYR